MSCAHVSAQETGSWQAITGTNGTGDRPGIHHRGCGGHVQEHVVESGVISDAEPATNNGFVAAQEARLPGKANVRTEVLEVIRDGRNRGNRRWKCRIPERIGPSLVGD